MTNLGISNSFWDGAAGPIIGAIIGAVGTLAVQFYKRTKPSRIVCGILSASPTVKFSHGVDSKVEVRYNGTPAKSLAILEIVVFNDSQDTIKNIDLVIELSSSTRILELERQPSIGLPFESNSEISVDNNKLRLKADYLNSFAIHGDKMRLKMICDGEVDSISVVGRGDGWSVDKRTIHGKIDELWGMLGSTIILAILGGLMACYRHFYPLPTPPNTQTTFDIVLGCLFGTLLIVAFVVSIALPQTIRDAHVKKLRQ